MKSPELVCRLITTAFQIFGLQYFSIKNVLENGVPQRLPYLRGIFMLFLMSIYATFLSLYMFHQNNNLEWTVTAKTILTTSIQHALRIGLFIIIFQSLLQSFLSTGKIAQIYCNFKRISLIIDDDFKVTQDYKKIRRKLNRHALMMFFSYIFLEIFSMIISATSLKDVILSIFALSVTLFLVLTIIKFIF